MLGINLQPQNAIQEQRFVWKVVHDALPFASTNVQKRRMFALCLFVPACIKLLVLTLASDKKENY